VSELKRMTERRTALLWQAKQDEEENRRPYSEPHKVKRVKATLRGVREKEGG
jgi:hypothetical protein